MPSVTVNASPAGLPAAITFSPTLSSSESPKSNAFKSGALIFNTAMSAIASYPATAPTLYVLPE